MSSKLLSFFSFQPALFFLGVARMPKNFSVPSRQKLKCYTNGNVVYKTSHTTRIPSVFHMKDPPYYQTYDKNLCYIRRYMFQIQYKRTCRVDQIIRYIVHDSAYSDKHHFRTISGLAIKVIGNGNYTQGQYQQFSYFCFQRTWLVSLYMCTW